MTYEILGVELFSFIGLIFMFGLLLVMAKFYKPISQLPIINAVPNKGIIGAIMVVAALVMAGTFALPTTTVPEEDVDYYSTTDLTIYTYDEIDGSSINGDVLFFETGASDEDYYRQGGDAQILRTITTSGGEATVSGWDTEKYPEAAVLLDISDYYNTLQTQDLTVQEDSEENTKTATYRATTIGTISLDRSDSTLTVTEGDTESYTIIFENTASDSEVWSPAIKFDGTGADLESVGTGARIETVNDVKYVVPNENAVEGNDIVTVSIDVTNTTSTASSFTLTANDLFMQYGADAFNTYTNVNSATDDDLTVSI